MEKKEELRLEVTAEYPKQGIPIQLIEGLKEEIIKHLFGYGFFNINVKDDNVKTS
jgi:hypothetical protein